jgi:DNA-binding NtrC family response regulator
VTSGITDDHISIPIGVSMNEAEKEIIKATLTYCKGNKSKAAELLGIGRKTLHRKVQEYHLEN